MSGCVLEVNGKRLEAERGETLVDAALAARIVIPHDCATGQCGTCRVTVLEGDVDDQGTRSRQTVLACRAKVTGPARIAFDPVPDVQKMDGEVTAIRDLSPDVAEVRIRMKRRFVWLPGQYVKVTFRGFPARDLSPTFALDLAMGEEDLVFQMTRHENGQVSSELGRGIRVGHAVSVRGPFGSAFLRRGEGPLVLASTGTGFAPVFAIAIAARMGQPWRPVTIIAGARHRRNLYMATARRLLEDKGATVILTASDGDGDEILTARPQLLLPALTADATVIACGAPGMVEAVERATLPSGAEFHADSFTPAPMEKPSLGKRLKGLFGLSKAAAVAGG